MKNYSSRIRCGFILALSAVAFLCFVFLPVLSIRPSDFGLKEVTNVEINSTIWDVRKDFRNFEKKITDKVSAKELQNLEEEYGSFADFIPGYSKEDLHKAVEIITWWLKFPVYLNITIGVALGGLVLSCGFAVVGLTGSRKKWLGTFWCTLGAALYLMSGVALCIWGVKAAHDLSVLLDNQMVQKIFDLKALLGSTAKMTQQSIGVLLRCGSTGLFIPWICSVIVAVLGTVNAVIKSPEEQNILKAPAFVPGMEQRCTGTLQITAGEYAGNTIHLGEGESLCIGSDPKVSQLILSGRKTAPCQCRITYCKGIYMAGRENTCYEVTNLAPDGQIRVSYRNNRAGNDLVIPYRRAYKVNAGGEISLEPGKNKIILR